MVRILITAFEPFGTDRENAAALVCEQLPTEGAGYRLIKRILPTEFEAGKKALLAAIEEVQPELVLCLGQAGMRNTVTPERVAINLMDGRIPDNGGYKPDEEPVITGGPEAYFTNVPVKRLVQAAKTAGYPVSLSYSAGAYVCNCVFYTLMHHIAYQPAHETLPALWGDFIHVPYLQEQSGKPDHVPALPLKQAVGTVQFLIEELVREKQAYNRLG